MKDGRSALLWFTGRMALFAIAASLILPVALASGQTTPYVPGNDNGLFVVENAWAQFAALKHHGEALAWNLREEDLGAPDPSDRDHYQGLARYPGDGAPVFYVTQLDDDDHILPGASDKGGYLHVVKFGTRPTTGERLRSNLLAKFTDTEDTYPKIEDTWTPLTQFKGTTQTEFQGAIRFDGSLIMDSATMITSYSIDPDTEELIWETSTWWNYPLPAYNHPGSMAIVDDILFVPLDTRRLDDSPIGFIVLFDLRENGGSRENPVPIHAIQLTHKIDNLAVTEYEFPDGGEPKYLVWVNGDGGSVTKFYRTTSSDLRDDNLGLTPLQDWKSESDLLSGDWPTGAGAHQSSTFLRDKNGLLYMIGMRHPGGSPTVGSDYADLYWVREDTPGHFTLTYVGERKFYCAYDGGGGPEHMRICNFGAASNAYVSPSGELILYSTPHADEDGKDPDFVRLGEFRHRDVNFDGTCTRWTGWAELYDDKNFLDRSIVFDWADRDKDDFDNFSFLDGFDGKTSSLRWCAPVGCNIILYEYPYYNYYGTYGGVSYSLPGTGVVEEIPDGGSWVNSIRFDPNSICKNSLPIAEAGLDQTLSAGPDCTATVALDGSGSSDPDGDPLTYTWTWDNNIATGVSPTILLPVGTTIIILVVNDGIEDSVPDTVTITVTDDTPPGMSLSASPQSLWPPNHKMVPVTIAVSTFDNCDSAPICQIISVESNEPVNGSCDGNKAPDWEITGDLTVDLRAERSGCGSGRVYTIQVQCTDAADNSSVGTVEVYVPHDQGDRPDLNDDDGDGYSENQGDCNDNDDTICPSAEEICGDGIDQNCNGIDLPCGDDSDEDGIANDQDSCLDSDLSETVVIDGCDSGVANTVLSNGCTISDEIAKCGTDSSNHGQYVSCVSHLTNDLMHDGVLTGREKGAIQSCVAGDGDIDGVPDPAEQGPQGNHPNYDGNKDGMPDSQQGNVVSCHTHDQKHYVTMACSEPITGAAAVEKPMAAGSPSGVEFPYGFFEFAIHVLNPGDATKMTLYLPVGANPTTYYKYGPTPDDLTDHWYEFMYDAQTLTGAEISGNVVTLHFVDGQRGDDDLTANGTIVDQGGPGITSTSTTSSSSGSSGCFITTAAYGSPM